MVGIEGGPVILDVGNKPFRRGDSADHADKLQMPVGDMRDDHKKARCGTSMPSSRRTLSATPAIASIVAIIIAGLASRTNCCQPPSNMTGSISSAATSRIEYS